MGLRQTITDMISFVLKPDELAYASGHVLDADLNREETAALNEARRTQQELAGTDGGKRAAEVMVENI